MNMLAELTDERGPSLETVIGACLETRKAFSDEWQQLSLQKEISKQEERRMRELSWMIEGINERLQWLNNQKQKAA